MTVDELIEQLRNLSAAGHGHATVRLAHQPHYPFEYSTDGLKLHQTNQEEIDEIESFLFTSGKKYPEDADEARQRLEELQEQNETILYIREGAQLGYISRNIWDD